MILTLANIKGGSTRTTSAIFLAYALSRMGHDVTVVDTDPRGDAQRWTERRTAENVQVPFQLVRYSSPNRDLESNPDHLAKIQREADQSGITIVDTQGHTPRILREAAKIFDFVLVPFATSIGDLAPTVRTLRSISAPRAVLMTRVRGRTREEQAVRPRLVEADAYVFSTTIPERAFFQRANGTIPTTDLHSYAEAAQELMYVLDLLRESAAGRRNQVVWEEKRGASLFTGLTERMYSATYNPSKLHLSD